MKKTRRTQTERRQEAETRLLDAAISLIANKGLDGLTLAEVGVTAGYSKTLPIHYFENKDKLVEAVVKRLIDRSLKSLKSLERLTEKRGLDMIQAYYLEHAHGLRSASDESRALYALYLYCSFQPELVKLMKTHYDAIVMITVEQLKAAVALHQIHPNTDLIAEAEILVAFRRGAAMLSMSDPEFNLVSKMDQYLQNLRTRLAP